MNRFNKTSKKGINKELKNRENRRDALTLKCKGKKVQMVCKLKALRAQQECGRKGERFGRSYNLVFKSLSCQKSVSDNSA